jgi:type IV pilus assembly protein PilW
VTTGTGQGQRVAGSDSIELISAADTGLSVLFNNVTAASFQLNETSPTLQDGDVVIVCDPDHAAIFQVTSYTNSPVTLGYITGTGTPGNCSQGLGYPPACTTTTGNGYTYGPNSTLAELVATDWFIGNNPVGGKSLYRMQLATSAAGVPAATTAEEMVRDVTAMSIGYHVAPNANFIAASAVTDWSKVDAVQVTLTLQSVDQRAGTDVKPITRNYTATTTVRNRVD